MMNKAKKTVEFCLSLLFAEQFNNNVYSVSADYSKFIMGK